MHNEYIKISKEVAAIEGEAFRSCSGAIDIEDGDNMLNFKSFNYQGNEYPKGLKYEWFMDCQIKTLHLGRNYTYDGYSSNTPFREMFYLQTLTIGNKVTSIDVYAFANCTNLISVIIEDGPSDLKFTTWGLVGNYFDGSPIKTLYLGRNLDYLSDFSFIAGVSPFAEKTSLTTITIGNYVGSIGNFMFYGCSGLNSVVIIPNSVTSIGWGAFRGCVLLPAITMGANVEKIEYSAFFQCRALTSITIPKSVREIGGSAFANCDNLASLIIEDGPNDLTFAYGYGSGNYFGGSPIKALHLGRNLKVTNISEYIPFREKTSLTTLTIGSLVSSIGESAFQGCTGLSTITSKNPSPPTAGNYCFDGVNKTACTVNVPAGYKCAYKSASQWKDFTNILDGTNTSCSTPIDNAVANQLSISPNPAQDYLYINGIETETPITISDVSGKVVLQTIASPNEAISVVHLPKGVYMVQVAGKAVKVMISG